jgi:hypothetical protein
MDDDFRENDPLWDLLGKARQPARPSPFFSRNVLRRVREERPAPAPRWMPRWLAPAALALLVGGFAASLAWMPGDHQSAGTGAEWIAYFDAAAGIDDLVPPLEFTMASFTGESFEGR